MRVLLDSNVWLAILTTDGFCRHAWRAARDTCQFAASRQILDGITEKLRTKFGFSPRHARLMTFFVERQTEAVEVASSVDICRDADDNRILAASLDSGCSHLHRLGNRQAQIRKDVTNLGFQFRLNPGADVGGLAHAANVALIGTRGKRFPAGELSARKTRASLIGRIIDEHSAGIDVAELSA